MGGGGNNTVKLGEFLGKYGRTGWVLWHGLFFFLVLMSDNARTIKLSQYRMSSKDVERRHSGK